MRKKCGFIRKLVFVIGLGVMTTFSAKAVNAMTVLETDVERAADDCTMLGVYGSYYSQAQDALDRINEIRKEACEEGDVPDPRNPKRMLTASDYVPIKWSANLERVARIRAMEGGLARDLYGSGHKRLNGRTIWGVVYNGMSSATEDLAYNNGTSMVYGINQWYREKKDWVDQNSSSQTGHYTSIIDPDYTYVGLGDFYSEEVEYPNTLAGELSASTKELDQTMQEAPQNVMQKIEVKNTLISGYLLDGVASVYTDQIITLTAKAQLVYKDKTHKLWLVEKVSYYSSDTSVATVTDSGVVKGIKNGKTIITAKIGDKVIATKEISVKCNHEKTLISEKQPTCTTEGLKVYRCNVCGEQVEQAVPKTAHDYVYGKADDSGKMTGVCTVCHDSVTCTPPTYFEVWWRNSQSSSSYYSSAIPSSNGVGSIIYCWIDEVNGDSGYQDMVIESTDETVVSVPDKVNNHNSLNVLSNGITILTIYPKYNPAMKKTYVVRIGDSGSVDISPAVVTLSKDHYEYNGQECKPQVQVFYHDTLLTKNTDYTVSYNDQTKIGTANVVITGKGIFTGSIEKEFFIEHTKHTYGEWKIVTAATCKAEGRKKRVCKICDAYETDTIARLDHVIVTDQAVPATCTEDGRTEGSHCSRCGEILTVSTKIDALGHSYVNGVCENCGDILPGGEEKHTHNMTYHEARMATCVEAGNKAYYICDKCGKLYNDESGENEIELESTILPAQGHKWDENYTVDIEATATTEGSESIHCSICDVRKDVRVIPVKEHNKDDKEDTGKGDNTDKGDQKEDEKEDTGKDDNTDKGDQKGDGQADGKENAGQDNNNDKGNQKGDGQADDKENVGQDNNNDKGDQKGDGQADGKENAGQDDNNIREDKMKYPVVGSVFVAGGLRYRVVKSNSTGNRYEVSCTGAKTKKIKNANIKKYIRNGGFEYVVVQIEKNAFYNCKYLKKVTIPDSVEKIGAKAFAKCKNLSRVTIKSSLLREKSIGKQAFSGIHKKAVVKVPAKKKSSYKKWLKKRGISGKKQKVK